MSSHSTISSRPSIFDQSGEFVFENVRQKRIQDSPRAKKTRCCQRSALIWITVVLLAFIAGLTVGVCGSTGRCLSRSRRKEPTNTTSDSEIIPQPANEDAILSTTPSLSTLTFRPSTAPRPRTTEYTLSPFVAEYFDDTTLIVTERVDVPALHFSDDNPFHGIPAQTFRGQFSAQLVVWHKLLLFSWDPLVSEGTSVHFALDGKTISRHQVIFAISPGSHSLVLTWNATDNTSSSVRLLAYLRRVTSPTQRAGDAWPLQLLASPVLSKRYLIVHVNVYEVASQYLNTTVHLKGSSVDRPVVLILNNSKPVHWIIDSPVARVAVYYRPDSVVTGVNTTAPLPLTTTTWPGRPADQVHMHWTLDELTIEL